MLYKVKVSLTDEEVRIFHKILEYSCSLMGGNIDFPIVRGLADALGVVLDLEYGDDPYSAKLFWMI